MKLSTMEIWKEITGYENLYEVSNLGRIKSLGNGKTKKEKIRKLGVDRYLIIRLCKNNLKKTIGVHVLVAREFIPNPNNLPYVCHKDDNPHNNHVENLYWGTQQDNMDDKMRKNRWVGGRKKKC
jgi:hypothetical protein